MKSTPWQAAQMRAEKQAAMLLLVATLATSQAAPTTTLPSVTRAGAEITAFDCHQLTQMQTEPAAERCGRAPPLTISGQATLVQRLTIKRACGWTCELNGAGTPTTV